MTNQQQKSTKAKSKDLGKDKSNIDFIKSSFLGTFLVILSGVIIYTDKIIVFFDWNFNMPSRYDEYDFETFIWSVSVTVSPLLLVLAAHIKTFKMAYIVPLYSYTLQFWFIVFDLNIVDKEYTWWYALATSLLIVVVFYLYKRREERIIKERIAQTEKELIGE